MSIKDFPSAVFFTDQSKKLNDRFHLLLFNIVTAYPERKLHPSAVSIADPSKTNKEWYDENMADMMHLQNEYFMLKNNIVKTSEDLMIVVNKIDDKINALDSENLELTKQLDGMADSTYSAEGMLDDSQITRNQLFYGNIVLFVIMATGGYMYYKKVSNT
jgi:hypothetical protein